MLGPFLFLGFTFGPSEAHWLAHFGLTNANIYVISFFPTLNTFPDPGWLKGRLRISARVVSC